MRVYWCLGRLFRGRRGESWELLGVHLEADLCLTWAWRLVWRAEPRLDWPVAGARGEGAEGVVEVEGGGQGPGRKEGGGIEVGGGKG